MPIKNEKKLDDFFIKFYLLTKINKI